MLTIYELIISLFLVSDTRTAVLVSISHCNSKSQNECEKLWWWTKSCSSSDDSNTYDSWDVFCINCLAWYILMLFYKSCGYQVLKFLTCRTPPAGWPRKLMQDSCSCNVAFPMWPDWRKPRTCHMSSTILLQPFSSIFQTPSSVMNSTVSTIPSGLFALRGLRPGASKRKLRWINWGDCRIPTVTR